jgi:hypothetical protein
MSLSTAGLPDLLPTPGLLLNRNDVKAPSAVERGNGIFVSPNLVEVITTSNDGSVAAFDAFGRNTDIAWIYTPPLIEDANISCFSGIAFSTDTFTDLFMVYSIVDDIEANTAFGPST